MADEAKAMATMIANIEKQTGKTLAQLGAALKKSGLAKHGELRQFLMDEYGLGHGQANTVVHLALKSDGGSLNAGKSGDDVLAGIYADKKAALRPIHDALLAYLGTLGEFETAPKKDYVSYRRKKQFVMIGPKTATAVEIGFGAKALPKDARLKEMPPNSMCKYTTRIGSVAEIDAKLKGWIKAAYDEAG
jgi:hypothetical protein